MSELRELVVVSGKGGTGKTSVAAALAASLGRLVLADYDVDAANLHLALGARRRGGGPFFAGWEPEIDPERCTGCGRCTDACRFGAVLAGAMIAPWSCEGCGVCALACPARAVEMVKSCAGQWLVSETMYGPLVHAELGPGRENSGKLVARVKDEARRIAADEGLGLILGDGPPGIGCAAIAAISRADAVLIVTEPSLSARHDMERVLDLCRRFRLPALVCLNKCDIWPAGAEEVAAFCAERGARLIGMIPWDESVPRAARRGEDISRAGSLRIRQAVGELARALQVSLESTLQKEERK